MSRIRSRDTKPELRVRKVAHAMGLRYRLHRKDLPGTPDLVFPKYRVALFVHGCFWHRHKGCKKSYEPKSRIDFWKKKFQENVSRDRQAFQELKQLGWTPAVIWECETDDEEILFHLIKDLVFFSAYQKPSPKNSLMS